MMNIKFLSMTMIMMMGAVSAYSNSTLVGSDSKKQDAIDKDTTLVVPQEFDNSLDYMLQSWVVKGATKSDCKSSSEIVYVSDSTYKSRLSKLPYLMEMPYNSTVRAFIELYVVRKRRQMEYMLGMSNYYFPVFEQALAANKLPLELKNLSIIESALNTTIVSRMGAAGLWQLMINTGKMYGLEINSLVDERLSPVKATNAAARFLKDLYSIYGDWHLVIAAYNCGPGNVNKAIRKSGGKRDYWEIYPYLPRETRGYVPIFIAANYAMHYAKEHNLCSATINMPAMTDTVMVRQRIHLQQIATVLNLPIEQVRLLNPQYTHDIIPGDIKPYALCLPMKDISAFTQKFEQVSNFKADELVNNRRAEIDVPTVVCDRHSTDKHGKVKEPKHKKGRHRSGDDECGLKVKKGQTLGEIAAKYGVSVKKLRKLNKIKGSTIRAGAKIKIK
jgi:membrane-bound lytic murein transglycosylase D